MSHAPCVLPNFCGRIKLILQIKLILHILLMIKDDFWHLNDNTTRGFYRLVNMKDLRGALFQILYYYVCACLGHQTAIVYLYRAAHHQY